MRYLRPGIVIYETTHHETLPALLDLSEASFDRVTVFLKQLSFANLSGQDDPARRWPGTRFVIQEESNRAFIGRMLQVLRKEQYSHLHLSTLDNNLLLLGFRLWLTRDVHVSLTVHEVNEYFAYSFSSFRDLTESLAKIILRRRIRHYRTLLPAMAERLLQRIPGAAAVFIPSRFYSSEPPSPLPDTGSHFRVVVPGSVDPKRRDYEELVVFFSECSARKLIRPVELVILGDSDSPYGRSIMERLQGLESAFFRCHGYQGYIPEKEYERQICSADLLWSPLRINKKSSRTSYETYGQTTASGLTGDLLLYHVPVLTPAGFELPGHFQPAQLTYSSREDLHAILGRLMEAPDLARSQRLRIHESLSFFNKENFIAAFRSLTGPDEKRQQG